MTSLVFLLVLVLFCLAYRFYGGVFVRKIMGCSEKTPTPAHAYNDGVDYVPAPRMVLFGHHFASIAGAAPIVGPAMALAWGWLPAILWIIFGNIFLGAVHDYLSLTLSVRHGGKSIQYVAKTLFGKKAGLAFSIFILFLLILIIAAFSAIIGNIFVKIPESATAYISQIVIALLLGVLIYRTKLPFWLSSLIGILLLGGGIYGSQFLPIAFTYKTWVLVFFFYIIIASALPVNVLLQPRDYLNSFLLYAGLIAGGLGALFCFKPFTFPAITEFTALVVDNKPSPLWPVILMVIACGSISGFHSLVASGTSSKQIDSQKDERFIGFGAMFSEGILSALVVVAIGGFGMAALGGDAFQDLLRGGFEQTYSSGFLKPLGGAAGAFSHSFACMTADTLGLPLGFMLILASMWVSAFAMTTLDTSNRLARYVLQEMTDWSNKKESDLRKWVSNRWVASAIPAAIGIYLAYNGSYSLLFPTFGGANQLIASIALFTAAFWVKKNVCPKYTNWVLFPAIFVWLTVTAGFFWFLWTIVPTLWEKNIVQGILISGIVLVEIILNFMLATTFFRKMKMG